MINLIISNLWTNQPPPQKKKKIKFCVSYELVKVLALSSTTYIVKNDGLWKHKNTKYYINLK